MKDFSPKNAISSRQDCFNSSYMHSKRPNNCRGQKVKFKVKDHTKSNQFLFQKEQKMAEHSDPFTMNLKIFLSNDKCCSIQQK